MMHAEICPVRGGNGKVWPPGAPQVSAPILPMMCHGCGGRGWVEVAGGCPRLHPMDDGEGEWE